MAVFQPCPFLDRPTAQISSVMSCSNLSAFVRSLKVLGLFLDLTGTSAPRGKESSVRQERRRDQEERSGEVENMDTVVERYSRNYSSTDNKKDTTRKGELLLAVGSQDKESWKEAGESVVQQTRAKG